MERAKPAAAAHGAPASALGSVVGCATSSFEMATLAPAGVVGGVEAPR